MDNIDLKEMKVIDKDILKQIIDKINDYDEDLEDFSFELSGKKYGFFGIEEDEWQDDGRGKYFSRCNTYGLALFGKKWSIKEKYNFIVTQVTTRSGSYYTDWDYSYDTPEMSFAIEETIPEQIIPEHVQMTLKTYEA